MTRRSVLPRFQNLPIAGQLVMLLVVALAVGQLATLLLTLIFPPQPAPQRSLGDIARALRGQAVADNGQRPLIRVITVAPPVPREAGWLTAAEPRDELAGLLAARPGDVRLMFYVPLPSAGASPWARTSILNPSSDKASMGQDPNAPRLILARYEGQAGGPPMGGPSGGFPSGGFPGGGFPAGGYPGSGFPSSPEPVSRAPSTSRSTSSSTQAPSQAQPNAATPVVAGAAASQSDAAAPIAPPAQPASGSQPSMPSGPGEGGVNRPDIIPIAPGPIETGSITLPGAATLDPPLRTGTSRASPEPIVRARATTPSAPMATTAERSSALPTPEQTPATVKDEAVVEAEAAGPDVTGQVPSAPLRRGLFAPRTPSHVEGDFIAARKIGPDEWVVVRPKPEGFPSAWQARVMLWFLIALGLVVPLGWLAARWITVPLRGFADAADRLGRDPTAPVMVGEGGAELGRAARAFNLMQTRLRRYVDDRTAMIGAISHDLRTPLARMRFRIERTPDDVRPAFERDIAQMNAMIDSVLMFMRERSDVTARQRVDLRSVLEVAVDDAVEAGGDVQLEPGDAAETEVDLLGMQRVFANLLDNALKYGDRAVVRLRREGVEAVIEVIDFGPGLSPEELDNVFRPFYRTPGARAGEAQGVGLGLATVRSILRAHGGDICLSSGQGLVAEIRLPVAA